MEFGKNIFVDTTTREIFYKQNKLNCVSHMEIKLSTVKASLYLELKVKKVTEELWDFITEMHSKKFFIDLFDKGTGTWYKWHYSREGESLYSIILSNYSQNINLNVCNKCGHKYNDKYPACPVYHGEQ